MVIQKDVSTYILYWLIAKCMCFHLCIHVHVSILACILVGLCIHIHTLDYFPLVDRPGDWQVFLQLECAKLALSNAITQSHEHYTHTRTLKHSSYFASWYFSHIMIIVNHYKYLTDIQSFHKCTNAERKVPTSVSLSFQTSV